MVIKTAQFLDIYHLKTCFNVKTCHLVILKNVNLFSRDGRPAPWKKGLPRPAPQKLEKPAGRGKVELKLLKIWINNAKAIPSMINNMLF